MDIDELTEQELNDLWYDEIQSGIAPDGNWNPLIKINKRNRRMSLTIDALRKVRDDLESDLPELHSKQEKSRKKKLVYISKKIHKKNKEQFKGMAKYVNLVQNRHKYKSWRKIFRKNIYQGHYKNPWEHQGMPLWIVDEADADDIFGTDQQIID